MVQIDLTKQIDVSRSVRARQLEGMFDVPPRKTQKQHWQGDVPLDDFTWNVGLIVGPSGSGKSSVARVV